MVKKFSGQEKTHLGAERAVNVWNEGAGGSLVASVADIDSVAAAVAQLGRQLGNPREAVAARWVAPIVPEAEGFLQALTQARGQHATSLQALSSFFLDAHSSLTHLNSQFVEHERGTAANWNRWER